MTLEELQFAQRLLKQGVPLGSDTVRKVVEHALEATEQLEALKSRTHAEHGNGKRNGAGK